MSIIKNFFDSLNDPKAALWSAGVAFNRSNPLPLDKWSVFATKADAINYVENNAVAYPGQIIAVYDNNQMQAFILAESNNQLALQPIGIIPTGSGPISVDSSGTISLGVDNQTIQIVDNVLTLVGFDTAAEGAQLTKTSNGLEWVATDDTIINLDEVSNLVQSMIGQPATYTEDGEIATEASGIYATVYTQEETNKIIDKKIAAIDHLKRKTVVSTESINLFAADADQYIYMIPNSKGSYDEYMVIENELEKVGDWSVDLDAYATKADLESERQRAIEKENALSEALDEKVDLVYYPVTLENGEVIEVPGTLLSPEDKKILDALVLDNGEVGISQKINANNIEGLDTWLYENGPSYLQYNLSESNLTPELASKINYITTVDSNNFEVNYGELKLINIDYTTQIQGLPEVLESKASASDLDDLEKTVNDLEKDIYGYEDLESGQTVSGALTHISKLNTSVANLEELIQNTVSKDMLDTAVGDLEILIENNKNNIDNLIDRVNYIETQLTWEEISITEGGNE